MTYLDDSSRSRWTARRSGALLLGGGGHPPWSSADVVVAQSAGGVPQAQLVVRAGVADLRDAEAEVRAPIVVVVVPIAGVGLEKSGCMTRFFLNSKKLEVSSKSIIFIISTLHSVYEGA